MKTTLNNKQAEPVLIVGHRNPDNDSICSAVAYANLKNELSIRKNDLGEDEAGHIYIPVRLGKLPNESKWVLEKNGIALPELISHVYTRVMDVMTPNPVCISPTSNLLDAGRLLKKHNIRSLVVVDDDGSFQGLISTRNIAERYVSATEILDENESADTHDVAVSLKNSLSQPVKDLMSTDVLTVEPDALLKDTTPDLMESALRECVVVDDENHVLGIVTRSDIATNKKRKVILVDHNEITQAALGIQSAEVVEIVDHHRIADVSTSAPIKFLALPIGATATIIAMEYAKHNVEITPAMAQVLLSAIMTDTVLLKSPTTTHADREQAEILAEIAGVDKNEFGIEVYKTRGNEKQMSVEELITSDAKEFVMDDVSIMISAFETVDLASVLAREDEIRMYMRDILERKGYEFVLFMVTDISRVGSQFICEGNRGLMNKAFNIKCTGEGGTWMPGIISRKKQVAARLLNS